MILLAVDSLEQDTPLLSTFFLLLTAPMFTEESQIFIP
jgi:hypothetical protein